MFHMTKMQEKIAKFLSFSRVLFCFLLIDAAFSCVPDFFDWLHEHSSGSMVETSGNHYDPKQKLWHEPDQQTHFVDYSNGPVEGQKNHLPGSFYLRGGECGRSAFSFGSFSEQIEELQLLNRTAKTTRRNEFPWNVFVIVTNGRVERKCSGAILDSNWVLTTASCVKDAYHDPKKVHLFFGAYEHPLLIQKQTQVVRYNQEPVLVPFQTNALQIQYHPNFDSHLLTFDFALIEHDGKLDFQFSEHLQPVCLPSLSMCPFLCSVESSGVLFASGWTGTKNYKQRSNVVSQNVISTFPIRNFQNFTDCIDRRAHFDESQRCVKTINNLGHNSCHLLPGSLLLQGFSDAASITYSLCGLKSAHQRNQLCHASPGFFPYSTAIFNNICPALEWIDSRDRKETQPPFYFLPTTSTTTTMEPFKFDWWQYFYGNLPPDYDEQKEFNTNYNYYDQ